MSAHVTGLGLGLSNNWNTPPAVFEALGERFDLDVSAPIDGPLHVPTSRWFSSHALEQDWFGFVWMNPPFGGRNGLYPWLEKFFAHGNGIALTPDRTSAPWFQDNAAKADKILFCRKQRFLDDAGNEGGSPAFGTALWASGDRAVAALSRAAAAGFGLPMLPERLAA
jgi:hypothetical protein